MIPGQRPPYDRPVPQIHQVPVQRTVTVSHPNYKKMNFVHFLFSGGPSYEMMTNPGPSYYIQTFSDGSRRLQYHDTGGIAEYHKPLPINAASIVVILSLLGMVAEIVLGVISAITLTTLHFNDPLFITIYALALFLLFSVLGAVTVYFYAFKYKFTGFLSPMVLNTTGFLVNGAVLLLILIWLISGSGLPRSIGISTSDFADPATFIENAQNYMLYEAVNGFYALLVTVHILLYLLSMFHSYQIYCQTVHQEKSKQS